MTSKAHDEHEEDGGDGKVSHKRLMVVAGAFAALAIIIFAAVMYGSKDSQPQTTSTAAPQTVVAHEDPSDQVCGSDEHADCLCKGEGRVTRYLQPGETVLVKAYDGDLRSITFDPPPSPETFGYRDSVDEGDWVKDNNTNLQVHTTYEVRNFKKGVLPLRCHYS